MWIYQSPIGEIYIKQLSNGRYGMVFDGEVYDSCQTAQAMAGNIAAQCTGCSAWDLYDITDLTIPTDLSEWERVSA